MPGLSNFQLLMISFSAEQISHNICIKWAYCPSVCLYVCVFMNFGQNRLSYCSRSLNKMLGLISGPEYQKKFNMKIYNFLSQKLTKITTINAP